MLPFPAKFFPRDYIGAAPVKVGDTFQVKFFGKTVTVTAIEMLGGGSCFAQ